MRPRLALLAAVAGAVLVTSACDNPVSPDAATVNGTEISRDELYDRADAWAGIVGSGGQPVYALSSSVPDAYGTDGLAALLEFMVIEELVAQDAARLGVEIDPQVLDDLRGQDLGGYANLPASELDAFLRFNALAVGLQDHIETTRWWTDAQAEQYAEQAFGEVDVACTRHILVESEDDADDVLAQLDDGADFAELAAERSTDTQSGQQGGVLGCNPPGTFVEEFEDALEGAEPGDLIGPVETEFGYHVILVEEPLVQAGFQGWVEVVLGGADVDVDPRFGSWNDATFRVDPPPGATAPSETPLSTLR